MTGLPTGEQVELVHADQRAAVVTVGGGLRSYSAGGRELLDGFAADEQPASGRGQLLVPWPNRIEDGTYTFDGLRHRLPLTEPETGTAIHGLVRQAAWTVGARAAERVVLEHVLEPQVGYPFTLALAVEYVLSDDGLSVRITARNAGADACPYGCGQHPYLTLGTANVDGLELQAPGRRVLVSNARGLPTGSEEVTGSDFDFVAGRRIGATKLDNAFTDLERGPDGRALVRLRDPESSAAVTLWVDETFAYLMLFTGDARPDVNRRSLAAEPMTCPPNAFRSGESLIRLEPGEVTSSVWGIVPAAL
ncbi:MAG: aldose 1-epimerase family protein [Gaiellaceae bacterium]